MEAGADDVEIVTRFTSCLAVGDIETCLSLVADDLLFSEASSLAFGGDWEGKDGLVGVLRAVGRDYRVRLDAPQVSAAGDRVLVRVSGTIAARSTGRMIPLDVVDLYDVRDGLIRRVDVFYKDTAAVAGLLDRPAAAKTELMTGGVPA
ncbi:nuclear transport factor 2 family protein [Candidatus Protofrankia californiensis]|uniref:nuclear transport factor 2 family protein n=1 Tax=Candidatus Protofrankia californiensis TaxID=1839754 RepID=UPI0010415AFE|nr:nuclear transport factor 2 family protein [Candidatus Protofrankia californiensis]